MKAQPLGAMVAVAIVLTFPSRAPAQVGGVVSGQVPGIPPRDTRPAPQTGTAVIKGRVIEAVTGAAIPRARVRLQGRLNSPVTQLSDANGAFTFSKLPPGSFTVFAEKTGYMTGRYPDAGRTLRSGMNAPVTLQEGEVIDTLTVRLSRSSAVSGRVIDSYGDPVENVEVRLLRVPPSGRLTSLQGRGGASTNDLGEFRISRLEPGNYILLAIPRSFNFSDTENSGTQPAPTFYPGVQSIELAQPITVSRSQSFAGLVVPLLEGVTTTVSGTVLDSAGQPVAGNTSITARSAIKGASYASHSLGGIVRPDGTFRMTLSPGDYEIEARAMRRGVGGSYDPGDEQIGRQFVSVSGAPVSGIVVVLREPSTLRGRFVFDGIRPPPANPEVFREYYVIAVDDVESEVIRDPAFLERLVPQATRVTLIEGNPIQVSLRRISVQGSGAR